MLNVHREKKFPLKWIWSSNENEIFAAFCGRVYDDAPATSCLPVILEVIWSNPLEKLWKNAEITRNHQELMLCIRCCEIQWKLFRVSPRIS
jgi:hypothetical protein